MAIDLTRLSAALADVSTAVARAQREIDNANNPVVSGDYSDLGMLTRGVQPGSPEAESDPGTPPASAVSFGAATMSEASGGQLDNAGNPTGNPARTTVDPNGKPGTSNTPPKSDKS